jgi:hypothetical protein
MSQISRITTWVSNQVLTAAALNAEFNNLINSWNNQDSGSSSWSILKASGATTLSSTLNVTGATVLSSTLTIPNGTAAAPALVFAGAGTTGFLNSSGSPQLSIAGTAIYGWDGTSFYPVTTNVGGLGVTGKRFAASFITTLTLTNALGTASGGTGTTTKLLAVGNYSGNAGSNPITHGLGAAPGYVRISRNDSTGNVACTWWNGFTATYSALDNGTKTNNGITAVSSTQITLGTDNAVNANGVGYSWFAAVSQ